MNGNKAYTQPQLYIEPTLRRLVQLQGRVLSMGPQTGVKDVLHAIAEVANEILGAYLCLVLPYDETHDTFVLEDFTLSSILNAAPSQWTMPRSNGSARYILANKLLLVENCDLALERFPFLAGSIESIKDVGAIKAIMGICLEASDEKLGVLYADFLEPQEFPQEKLRTLELIAGQAAIAIQNTRQFENQRQASQQLSALHDMTRAIVSTLDLEVVLDVFLHALTRTLGFEYAMVSLVDPVTRRIESTRMILNDQINAWPDYLQQSSYSLEDSDILADIVRTGKIEVLDQWDDRFNRALWDKYDHERFVRIYMPMIGKSDEVLGVTEAGFYKASKATISNDEVDALRIYVDHAVLGIQNARLYMKTLKSSQEVEFEYNKVLDLEREIDRRALHKRDDVEELAQFTLDQLLGMFRFPTGWLLLTQGSELEIVAADHHHSHDIGRRIDQSNSISGLVAQKKIIVREGTIVAPEQEIGNVFQPIANGTISSVLALPLVIGDRCIGVLNLESEEQNAFSDHHESLMELFAAHLAGAITAARAREDDALLSRIAHEIAASMDVRETAQSILDQTLQRVARRSAEGDFGQILLRRGDDLITEWTTGSKDKDPRVSIYESASGLVFLPEDDPYRKMLEEQGHIEFRNESLIIPDVTKVKRYQAVTRIRNHPMQARSELALPVILEAEGEVRGVLNLESEQEGYFTESIEAQLVTFVAERASIIAQALNSRAKEDLDEILQQAIKLAKVPFAQLFAVHKDHLTIEATTGGEPIGRTLGVTQLEDGTWSSISGRAAQERRPINLSDVSKDPGYVRILGDEMKSELIVPLKVGGDTIGVINLESSIPSYFTEEHTRILERIASFAATAIMNASSAKARREAQVFARIGELVHDLNNRLGAISKNIELIRMTRSDLSSDSFLQKRFDYIMSNVDTVLAQVRIAREAEDEPIIPTAIAPVIDEALDTLEIPAEYHDRITIDRDRQAELKLPKVRATSKLCDIFHNMMANAIRYITYMETDGKLTIRTSISDRLVIESAVDGVGEWVDVFICDTGRGIEKEMWDKIFDSYADRKGEFHGLGLRWARHTVQTYGGTLAVYSSELGKGTCMRVRLPVAK